MIDSVPEYCAHFLSCIGDNIRYCEINNRVLCHIWAWPKICDLIQKILNVAKKQPFELKLNYCKKVFYFALNFLPWEFLSIKKLDFEKTKTTYYITFKTDMIKVVLVFSFSNLFTNKKSQGRKKYCQRFLWTYLN